VSLFTDIPDINLHFSSLMRIKIYYDDGAYIGKLSDVFVDYEEMYPLVIAIQYKKNNQQFYIAWNEIVEFSLQRVIVLRTARIGRSRTFPKLHQQRLLTGQLADQFKGEMIEYPALGKVILDRQIVDIFGKKVVRVNDIEFIKTGKYLRVTHAAVGLRSMFRRLGYEKAIDIFVKTFRPNANYLKKEQLINWKFVHAIPDKSVQDNVRLGITNEEIQKLHPADLADILEELDGRSRELLFSNLDPELAAATLSEIDVDMQAELLKNEAPEEVAKIIENLGTDEAADLLYELEDSKINEIISKIKDSEIQEEIQELLEYDEDTAGGLMSTEVFEISPENKKSDVLKIIQDQYEEIENIYDIFVVDNEGHLIGTTSLAKLLMQKEDVTVSQIMRSSDLKFLSPDASWKEVAYFMSKYNLINVPILDETQVLLGIVSVDDILPWILDE